MEPAEPEPQDGTDQPVPDDGTIPVEPEPEPHDGTDQPATLSPKRCRFTDAAAGRETTTPGDPAFPADDRRESDTELVAILYEKDEEWFTERLSNHPRYAVGGAAAIAAATLAGPLAVLAALTSGAVALYMAMPEDKKLAHLRRLATDHGLRSDAASADAIDKATSTAELKQVLKEMLKLDETAVAEYLKAAWEEALRQREQPTEPAVGHAEREARDAGLRILVIDGGGIKGLVPALIIHELMDPAAEIIALTGVTEAGAQQTTDHDALARAASELEEALETGRVRPGSATNARLAGLVSTVLRIRPGLFSLFERHGFLLGENADQFASELQPATMSSLLAEFKLELRRAALVESAQASQPDWSAFSPESAKKLGRGGTAVVYECNGCAVKVARADGSEARAERCRAELHNEHDMLTKVAAASDPEVQWCVRLAREVTEVQEVDGHHFFPLQLLDGFELEKVLAGGFGRGPDPTSHLRDGSGRLRSEATARWAAQLGEFVTAMDSNGLWHGDLKAKNIQIVSSQSAGGLGDVCVLDFAGGGCRANSPEVAADKLNKDQKRLLQLQTQLKWQCSEHEALVVDHVGDDPTRVNNGWQLLPYVNALADDEGATRRTFFDSDQNAGAEERFEEEEGSDDPFTWFFECLMDHLRYQVEPELLAKLLPKVRPGFRRGDLVLALQPGSSQRYAGTSSVGVIEEDPEGCVRASAPPDTNDGTTWKVRVRPLTEDFSQLSSTTQVRTLQACSNYRVLCSATNRDGWAKAVQTTKGEVDLRDLSNAIAEVVERNKVRMQKQQHKLDSLAFNDSERKEAVKEQEETEKQEQEEIEAATNTDTALAKSSSTQSRRRIRIMTWNIKDLTINSADAEQRMKFLARTLHKANPTIAIIQEVRTGGGGEAAIQKIKDCLNSLQSRRKWKCAVSAIVNPGRGRQEMYAAIYQADQVKLDDQVGICLNPDSAKSKEPASAECEDEDTGPIKRMFRKGFGADIDAYQEEGNIERMSAHNIDMTLVTEIFAEQFVGKAAREFDRMPVAFTFRWSDPGDLQIQRFHLITTHAATGGTDRSPNQTIAESIYLQHFVTELLNKHETVLLLGDFNTAEKDNRTERLWDAGEDLTTVEEEEDAVDEAHLQIVKDAFLENFERATSVAAPTNVYPFLAGISAEPKHNDEIWIPKGMIPDGTTRSRGLCRVTAIPEFVLQQWDQKSTEWLEKHKDQKVNLHILNLMLSKVWSDHRPVEAAVWFD